VPTLEIIISANLGINILFYSLRLSTSKQDQDDECDSSLLINSRASSFFTAQPTFRSEKINDNVNNFDGRIYFQSNYQQNSALPVIVELLNETSNGPKQDNIDNDKCVNKAICMSESMASPQSISAEVDRLLEIHVETDDFSKRISSGGSMTSFSSMPKSTVIILSPLSGNKIERKRIYTHQNKLNPIIHKNISIMKSKAAAAEAAASKKLSS
jgi:hypothetical protein